MPLRSGLQYKVLKSGEAGAKSPEVNSPCKCHYRGKLISGVEFDSSYKRHAPSTFAPNQVVKGWTEAMQLMKEGDKWELFLPSELAYGNSQRGQNNTQMTDEIPIGTRVQVLWANGKWFPGEVIEYAPAS